jgi:hypothetical protein
VKGVEYDIRLSRLIVVRVSNGEPGGPGLD